MLINWLDELLNYDFEIIHRLGVLNILPDHLSRLYPDENKEYTRLLATRNKEIQELEHKEQLDAEHRDLLEKQHLPGHFGADAIVQALRGQGHDWKNMKQEALKVVSSCAKCQKFNVQKHGFHPTRTITAELPGDHYAIDLAATNHRERQQLVVRWSGYMLTLCGATRHAR